MPWYNWSDLYCRRERKETIQRPRDNRDPFSLKIDTYKQGLAVQAQKAIIIDLEKIHKTLTQTIEILSKKLGYGPTHIHVKELQENKNLLELVIQLGPPNNTESSLNNTFFNALRKKLDYVQKYHDFITYVPRNPNTASSNEDLFQPDTLTGGQSQTRHQAAQVMEIYTELAEDTRAKTLHGYIDEDNLDINKYVLLEFSKLIQSKQATADYAFLSQIKTHDKFNPDKHPYIEARQKQQWGLHAQDNTPDSDREACISLYKEHKETEITHSDFDTLFERIKSLKATKDQIREFKLWVTATPKEAVSAFFQEYNAKTWNPTFKKNPKESMSDQDEIELLKKINKHAKKYTPNTTYCWLGTASNTHKALEDMKGNNSKKHLCALYFT